MERGGFLLSHISGAPYAGLLIKPLKRGSDAHIADSSFDLRTATFVIRPPELAVQRNKLRHMVRTRRLTDSKAQLTRKSQFLQQQKESFAEGGRPFNKMSSVASIGPSRAGSTTGGDDDGLVSACGIAV